jgi:predicted nucleotidyltransferase
MISVPLPEPLAASAAAIQEWAQHQPAVSAVFLFGSRLKGTNRLDSDLDVAVTFDVPERDEPDIFWIDHKGRWENELTQCVGLTIDLEIAHPALAPHVWGYLQKHHALIYVRAMA